MPAVILVAGEYDGPAVDVPLAKLGGGGAQIGPELVIGLSRLQTIVMRIAVRGDFLIGALQSAADHRWRDIIGVYPLAHAHFVQTAVVLKPGSGLGRGVFRRAGEKPR